MNTTPAAGDDPRQQKLRHRYNQRINTARTTLYVLAVLYIARIIAMEMALDAHTSTEGPNITTRLAPFIFLITAISSHRATLGAFTFARRFALLAMLVAVLCFSASHNINIYTAECIILLIARLLINRGKAAAREMQEAGAER